MSLNVGKTGSKQRSNWLSVYLQRARSRRKSDSSQPTNLWEAGDAVADGSLSSQFSTIRLDDLSKLTVGGSYLVSYEYDISYGSLQLMIGNAGQVQSTGSGSHSEVVVNNGQGYFRVRQTTSNTIGSLANISVTKV